ICKRKGGIIGGLLAAGFGNVVELIISVFALIHGEIEIVQTSLLGSIISNLLLVLGICIFTEGLYYNDQTFNEVAAQTIVVTVSIAISLECLVSSIEGTVKSLNISKTFVGVIIIPVVGNAAEHFTAVVAALRNKMDLEISISVGSSMQIGLFVIPMLVIFGWIIGQPMNFSFELFGCKSNNKLKKNEREKLYKENEIPDCVLCNFKHFRCKLKKCEECCNLNKCISYPCEYCKENNIDCEYSIIKTKEKFDELKKLGLSAYAAQLEYTLENKVHVQAYCQFKIRLTRSKIKRLFKNSTISFPDMMRSDTKTNIHYVTKKYNKCKNHGKKGCTCHYFDNEDYRCGVCNDKCSAKTKSRLDGLQSLVGPFRYDIKNYIETCDVCQRSVGKPGKFQMTKPIKATSPFVHIRIDFVGPLEITSQGNRWIIVATDYFIKWPEAKAVPAATAKETSKFLYENIICQHGVPTIIQSDRETNGVSNKAFDLLTKEEKVDKKVNTSKNSTIKSSSIVETSSAKDKELDWANEVETNIKTKKVLKLPLLSKGKDNKETHVNLAKVNTTQVNTSQVNKIIVTSQMNSEDQPIIEAQSTNKLVSDTDATPAQEKSQDKLQTKKWSELFPKFKGGKATFTNSIPKPKIHSKYDNALMLNIQNFSNIASNDIVAALAAKL
ncbi:16246_t:CDS:2, partial [Cetraspora pellucida]